MPTDVAGVADRPIGSLADLLAHLDERCAGVETAAQLAEIARRISARASSDGARHVDVIVNPAHWSRWRDRLGEMVGSLDAGWREAERDGGPTVGLCPSIGRDWSTAEADQLLDQLLELAHPRVVGISIDGNEARGSHTERFAPVFARAGSQGLRRCAHAGESSGAEGVREAVELLGAERIDHGIRCVEDPAVVRELAARHVPLDICPTSNVVLGVVADLDSHPIERLRTAGIPVSVNTDDPLLYGIDLVGEYARCVAAFSWGRADVAAVARTSIESCFAPEDRRAEMLDELDRFLGG